MSSADLGGYGGTIIITLVGMVGAVLLTVLAAYINGRIFARQLYVPPDPKRAGS